MKNENYEAQCEAGFYSILLLKLDKKYLYTSVNIIDHSAFNSSSPYQVQLEMFASL